LASYLTLVAMEPSTATSPPQSRNHILAVLPPAEFLLLRPHLTTVNLSAKQRLSEPNQPIPAVYFPLDTVISVAAVGGGGSAVEVGSVGCEGMAGVPLLFGSDRSPTRTVVQIAGAAERMDGATLQREAPRHPQFQRLLYLYTLGFLTQISQSTACNRLHPAERRLARWLLICRDRVGRDDVPITHETMAQMLGVRRATVTEAAGSLQRDGLIRYRRGVVTLVDRARLETAACECYRIVREEFDRLLGVRVG
jgi:CRP-like cAMP-binding protein